MSFITESHIKPSKIDGNRHDTRTPNIDHKKIGPSLSDIREPNLDPARIEKLIEEKAILLKEKEKRESTKGKGYR